MILSEDIRIPLKLRGVISYFTVRCPTEDEILNPRRFNHIVMTSPTEWEPYNEELAIIEDALSTNQFIEVPLINPVTRNLSTLSTPIVTQSYDVHDDFNQRLQRRVLVTLSRQVNATTSTRKGSVDAETLSKRWYIGLNAAQRTLERSTQKGVRDFSVTGGMKRLKHTAHQLIFRHIRATVYTDTLFNKVKSTRQNTCAQIFVTTFHWSKVYPLRSKGDAHQALDLLHRDVGVFKTIVPDNAPELISGEFRKKAVHAGSQIKPVEAYSHNQNLAESGIRELRRMYRKAMLSTNAPHVLWDYCISLMADIGSHTVLDLHELDGDSPQTRLTGDTVDISHLCEFTWYQTIWYVDPTDKMENKKLGKYLGPSHDVGTAMCSRILTSKCREISRTSVLPDKMH
jgi:hypothetical protein